MWYLFGYGGKNVPYNFSRFICDTVDDLAELPTAHSNSYTDPSVTKCSVGSLAKVVEDQTMYILNNNDEWCEYNVGGGGSFPDGNDMYF